MLVLCEVAANAPVGEKATDHQREPADGNPSFLSTFATRPLQSNSIVMIAFVMNSCYLVLGSEVVTKKVHASLQDCLIPGPYILFTRLTCRRSHYCQISAHIEYFIQTDCYGRDRRASILECTSISTVCPSAFNCCARRSAGTISVGCITTIPTAPMPSAILA